MIPLKSFPWIPSGVGFCPSTALRVQGAPVSRNPKPAMARISLARTLAPVAPARVDGKAILLVQQHGVGADGVLHRRHLRRGRIANQTTQN